MAKTMARLARTALVGVMLAGVGLFGPAASATAVAYPGGKHI